MNSSDESFFPAQLFNLLVIPGNAIIHRLYQLHQGLQRFPSTSTGIASFTFSAKLGLEHRGSRVPYTFHQSLAWC